MLFKIFGCSACIVGAGFLFLRNIFTKNQTSPVILVGLLVLALLLFISAARQPRKMRQAAAEAQRRQAEQQRARTAAPAASSGDTVKNIEFKVAGVTLDNEDGTSRQTILRALRFGDAPYASDSGEMDVDLEETTFNGEDAIEVHINGYMVGFVPKEKISQVAKAMTSSAFTADSAEITGGGRTSDGRELSFGCTVTASYLG